MPGLVSRPFVRSPEIDNVYGFIYASVYNGSQIQMASQKKIEAE